MIKPFDEIPCIEGERLILTRLEPSDSMDLAELMRDRPVYRYLPTFLLEQQCDDPLLIIRQMYEDCIREKSSLHLGIFLKEGRQFCGLIELYGFTDSIHKISIGYRLKSACWGRGIATEAVSLMIRYLYSQTDIQIITASTMPENTASARVLRKNQFELVVSGAEEDWGYDTPTPSDKWIR